MYSIYHCARVLAINVGHKVSGKFVPMLAYGNEFAIKKRNLMVKNGKKSRRTQK